MVLEFIFLSLFYAICVATIISAYFIYKLKSYAVIFTILLILSFVSTVAIMQNQYEAGYKHGHDDALRDLHESDRIETLDDYDILRDA